MTFISFIVSDRDTEIHYTLVAVKNTHLNWLYDSYRRGFWLGSKLNDYDSDFMLGTSTWEFVDFIVIGIVSKKQCRVFGTQLIIFITSITGAPWEHKYLSRESRKYLKMKVDPVACSIFKYSSGRSINVMRSVTHDNLLWFLS